MFSFPEIGRSVCVCVFFFSCSQLVLSSSSVNLQTHGIVLSFFSLHCVQAMALLGGLFSIPGESNPLSKSPGELRFVSKMKENHSLGHNHPLLPTSSVWRVLAAIQQQR